MFADQRWWKWNPSPASSLPSQIIFHLPMKLVDNLDLLLQLGWGVPVILLFVASLPIPWLLPLHRLVSSFAGRGKTSSSSSKRFTVPQRYFLHFYVLAIAWTTVLLGCTWFYARRNMSPLGLEALDYSTVATHLAGGSHVDYPSAARRRRVWSTVFVLFLMEAQVIRRFFETAYVFNYGQSARMHIVAYLTGIYFYIAAPLSVCSYLVPEVVSYVASLVAEVIVKGKDEMPVIGFDWWEYVKPSTNLGWCQWIGAAIFIWGWIHQFRCHLILGSLREQPRTDKYLVPCGDWFEYVSCPHYLAEIVLYAGIVIATGGLDLTVWLLFLFVASNLIFAAAQTHKWYHLKFENYPCHRCAVIPKIY